jgi:MFS family permease
LGVVLFAFNAFVVATALPAAVADLGGGAWIAWATSLYLIFSIVAGTATAAMMHRLGARALFLLAAAVFLAGTLMAAGAVSMAMLLAGRAWPGVGAGFIESGCYVLIPRLFAPRLIPKVFGVEAAAWALAAFGGPALSGWLTLALSWRVAFLATVPLALIFLALVPLVVRAARDDGPAPGLPLLPLGGIAGGMALILVADTLPWAALRAATLVAGFAVIAAVVLTDGRGPVRLLPARAFSLARATGLGLWVAVLMPLSSSAGTVFLNYTLQFLWGFTPVQSGLTAVLLALAWSAMQTLSAHLAWPRGRLIRGGAAGLVLGQALMIAAFALHSVALVVAAQLALGVAFGAAWGALSQVVMAEAPAADRDLTSALLPTVNSAGFGIGAALWGLVANALGFAGAGGADLQRVIVTVFALACLPALAALVLALRLARQIRVAS